ncbi:methyltransferase [Nostoc carneum NIES-2107]|nr:methyltransferase [Nostoc carneum NIES-2107]
MNEYLRPFHECPGCNSPNSKSNHLFNAIILGETCPVLKCINCGLVYKKFAPTAKGMAKIYSEYYVHFLTDSSQITEADINSAKQKLDRCRKLLGRNNLLDNLKLLDIGCGSGNFVKIAQGFNYLAEGIDPYLPPQLENTYLHKKCPEDIPNSSYDIAVLLNVAEHIDQPIMLFSAVRQLLKPGGVMLLTCPYGNSLARQIHQACWGHLALDEHLLFWTPASLTSLLRQLGFHGKVSYRIAGSPFPYGRVKPQTTVSTCTETQHQPFLDSKNQKQSLQTQVWQLARFIQRQEKTANLVRSLVHFTHTGDYLEYAINVG